VQKMKPDWLLSISDSPYAVEPKTILRACPRSSNSGRRRALSGTVLLLTEPGLEGWSPRTAYLLCVYDLRSAAPSWRLAADIDGPAVIRLAQRGLTLIWGRSP
jgi:hypothetical protein